MRDFKITLTSADDEAQQASKKRKRVPAAHGEPGDDAPGADAAAEAEEQQ